MSSVDFAKDVASGMLFFGIPDTFKMFEAIYYDDAPSALHYGRVVGTTHVMWYSAYRAVMAYDRVVKAGRNIMSFHHVMQGKNVLAGQALRHPAMLPLYAIESAIYQHDTWSDIGDSVTGAIHYSGAGGFTGGSMPVIPGDGGDHTTWFDLDELW